MALTGVSIEKLKEALGKSTLVKDSITFTIGRGELTLHTCNEAESFFKKITLNGGIGDTDFDGVLVGSVYKGGFFINKVLKHFTDGCTARIKYAETPEGLFGVNIELVAADKTLSLNYPLAAHALTKVITEEDESDYFGKEDILAVFEIDALALQKIKMLSGINAESADPIEYVNFIGTGGRLVATDTSFTLDLGEYGGAPFEAKLNREFIGMLGMETHTATVVQKANGNFVLVLEEACEDGIWAVKSGAVLMEDLDGGVKDADVSDLY